MSKNKPILTVSDAYDLMNRKIIINRMSIENLNCQIEYSNNSIKLQELTTKTATEKIKLINELNTLLEKQMHEFDDIRQEECAQIYSYINDLDTMPDEFYKICATLETHRSKMEDLMLKITKLEQTIPSQQLVTNFTVKRQLPSNITTACATEMLTPQNLDDVLPE